MNLTEHSKSTKSQVNTKVENDFLEKWLKKM